MVEKMNLEQFHNIKTELILALKEYENFVDSADYNHLLEQKYIEQYIEIQNRLLNYDLSDIPFEAWEGISLYSNDELDLSKTHANIDFSLLNDIQYGSINLKGCNAKGIQMLNYDENTFDSEFIQNNSEYFPDDSLPDEIKRLFYEKKLTFSDLIEYPLLRRCVNKFSFGEFVDKPSSNLVKSIGFENAIRLFDEYPNFVKEITEEKGLDSDSKFNFYSNQPFDKTKSYEEAKQFLYNQIINEIKLGYIKTFPSFDIIPKEMIDSFPHVFIKEELPKEIIEKYYNGKLSIAEIRHYSDVLKNKDLEIGIHGDWHKRAINKIFGGILNYIEKVPKEYDNIIESYLNHITHDEIEKLQQQEVSTIITDAIKVILKTNYYIEIVSLEELYACLKYVSVEEIFQEEKLREFITKCGFENIIEFNRRHDNILELKGEYSWGNNLLTLMSNYSDTIESNRIIDDNQKLTYVLGKIIHKMRFNNDYETRNLLESRNRELSIVFPNEFVDYELLDKILKDKSEAEKEETIKKLEIGFNRTLDDLLYVLNANPSLLPALENKNLNTEKYDKRLKYFYLRVGTLRFLEITSKYGNLVSQILNSLHLSKHEEFILQMIEEDYELKINSYVYNFLSSGSVRTVDISTLPKSFRKTYPELFIDENAPEELKKRFYGKNNYEHYFLLEMQDLCKHKEWLPFLMNVDLKKCLESNLIGVYNSKENTDHHLLQQMNFYEALGLKFNQAEILDFIGKYGSWIKSNQLNLDISLEKEEQLNYILENIYKSIKGKLVYHDDNMPKEFQEKYPKLFLDENSPDLLKSCYYQKKISPRSIQEHPEWKYWLTDKDISIACENNVLVFVNNCIRLGFDNNKIFEFFEKYGEYLGICNVKINHITEDNIEEIDNFIKQEIFYAITVNGKRYNEDAKAIIGEEYPELFLEEYAPEELKKYFYNSDNRHIMNFKVLSYNKEWLPFLKGKNLLHSLSKSDYSDAPLKKYFELFGEEKAIKFGISRTETVEQMIQSNQVELMKNWYDKTGGKFIPDFVVMQNFRLEEADKFLISGSNWSSLMRNKNFAMFSESRDAMLKLAYSFGVFDQDQRGFKKLQDLLTSLPKKIEAGYIIDRIDSKIDEYSQRGAFFKNKGVIDINGNSKFEATNMTLQEKENAYNQMIEYTKANNFVDIFDTDTLVNLLETLKKENVDIDFSKPIFEQIYKNDGEGTYSLTINSQSYPKSTQLIRSILEKFRELPIITPEKAHQLFGRFELKYDADFREFLLANLEKIISDSEYISFVSSVQRRFLDIKSINSNRTLTWKLAVSFVQTNKYTSINVGNERVAEISAVAGYSQADFNTLQEIYNYGKQRTFSSIPRIEKTSGKYTYEILRLDDPLAMAIGTLTDCCQELGDCAEVCMEHSMVDKNGRVFVIRDEEGNIVAQSWVWRNKDVLCFDNIEIPEKAFMRAVRENPELGRKNFAYDVYELYNQAAHDLIQEDEKIYRELLESRKITQEQYDGLRLGKVTVGLGFNDIAESLKQNSVVDKGDVSRPLKFEEPVKLSRGLYISDSVTQYILDKREDRKEFIGETLPVHADSYIEYTDSNFTEKKLLSLEKLEIVTKENPRYLETSVEYYEDSNNLVTEIARNYGLNPETTRIVMNPNFAIIYDIVDNKLRIGDLLFNTRVDNGDQQMDIESKVILQMRLALDQIAKDKEVDVSNLNEKQMKMYEKITALFDELDIERGVGHAK